MLRKDWCHTGGKPRPFKINKPIGRHPTLEDTARFYGLSEKQIEDIRDFLLKNPPKRARRAKA